MTKKKDPSELIRRPKLGPSVKHCVYCNRRIERGSMSNTEWLRRTYCNKEHAMTAQAKKWKNSFGKNGRWSDQGQQA